MRYFIAAAFLLLMYCSFAQQVIDVSKRDVQVGPGTFYTVGSEPFINAKFVNLVEGTPYFKDEWLNGVVVDKAGHEYKDVSIKIDLLENKVHYLDDKKIELIVTTPIKEIVLTNAAGDNFKFVHSSSFEQSIRGQKEGWYLWLSTGTASLYKVFEKNLTEIKPYGSATSEQRIQTSEKYLILYNNVFLEVKKPKDIPSVLTNKKAELEAFFKTNDDSKATMDDRFIKLIDYFNSLLKEQK